MQNNFHSATSGENKMETRLCPLRYEVELARVVGRGGRASHTDALHAQGYYTHSALERGNHVAAQLLASTTNAASYSIEFVTL